MGIDEDLKTNITTLKLIIDPSQEINQASGFDAYLPRLLEMMPILKSLFIDFPDRGDYCEPYCFLANYLRSTSLESLIIGGRAVRQGRQTSWHPLGSLLHLLNLRSIVAPQEALFEVGLPFRQCKLPRQLRSIKILNATEALDRWLWGGVK
jgi:hypothetical protein